ncbi:MAG TPA: carboxypeptidase-like regulatory domain-containing protein [Actinomycetota bacterium]|nr:carboxypeptidase-like regulatory domain-containing protein [Actinomycetota bacterium]
MPGLTGTIVVGGAAAEGAYVQIQNLAGDFQAEIRTDAAGRFLLHPIRGRWRLVRWLPGDGRAEQEVEVGAEDLTVEVALVDPPNLPG